MPCSLLRQGPGHLTCHGMLQNYRCVVILGKARSLTDPVEKAAALLKITEHIIPGRTQHARAASDRELAQTAVLAIDLDEVSAKVLCGPRPTLQAPTAWPIATRPAIVYARLYNLLYPLGWAHGSAHIFCEEKGSPGLL